MSEQVVPEDLLKKELKSMNEKNYCLEEKL